MTGGTDTAQALDTDVLVVGGGIAGCSLAYYLAREGVEVVLLERADLGGEASGANAGSLHVQIPHEEFLAFGEDWAHRFAPTLGFLKAAAALWAELEAELGTDLEVRLVGGLTVAETEAELAGLARRAAIERAHGLDSRTLGRDELRAIAPYVSTDMTGGLFCPHEGKANPLLATAAFARAARAAGARILRHAPLEAIERTRDGFRGRAGGRAVRCRRVVNAAGGEVARIGRMLGVRLAIDSYPIHMNVTEPEAPFLTHLLYSATGRMTMKQAANGTILIGGGWPAALDATTGRARVLRESIEGNLWVALSVVPRLGSLHVVRTWAGTVNGTDDWHAMVGEVPAVPGLFTNAFPWTGFTAAPLASRVLAERMCGRTPSFAMPSATPPPQ